MASTTWSTLGKVFYEPSATFAKIKDKPSPWLPMLTMMVLTAILMYWWISTADMAWLQQHMADAKPGMRPEEREAIAKFLTRNMLLWSTQAGNVVGTLVIFAVTALYYLLAGKFMGSAIGYGKWFGFAAWSAAPRLLAVPLMALQIATSHGQLAFEDANMLSLNFLVFHLPPSHAWASLVTSIDLTHFWSMTLAALGLKAWTGRSTGACVTVAVAPYVIIYGLWAVKVMVTA